MGTGICKNQQICHIDIDIIYTRINSKVRLLVGFFFFFFCLFRICKRLANIWQIMIHTAGQTSELV